MVVRGIHIVVAFRAQALESTSEEIAISVEQIRAQLIDHDENNERRAIRVGSERLRSRRRRTCRQRQCSDG